MYLLAFNVNMFQANKEHSLEKPQTFFFNCVFYYALSVSTVENKKIGLICIHFMLPVSNKSSDTY